MKTTLLLTYLVGISAGLIPASAMADCYDGCINKSVSIGYGIEIVSAPSEVECTACGGGDTVSYSINIAIDGCDEPMTTTGVFCTTDSNVPQGWFYVQSIGSGCSGTPQGCVRICSCPM
jgi:hypothetical protein